MVDPPPWPERPASAQDFDAFWLVRQLPPEPFPDEAYDYSANPAVFGPPGTRWVYAVADLAERETAPGVPEATRAAAKRLLARLKLSLPPTGSAGWTVPGAPPGPNEGMHAMPMMWVRTQIVGKIGNDEEVVHVLQWRHSTEENPATDALQVKILGTAVRNAWHEWMVTDGAQTFFPAELSYTEVRASLMTQVNPGEKPQWPLPTQVIPFNPALTKGNSTSKSLPYEVACALSLNTNWRGTSRFRGRLYLGPMTSALLGEQGQFSDAVHGIASTFGLRLIAGVAQASDYEAHVISQKYGTSAAITGVRVGRTPDSQRRRRRDRPELYSQAWGTAVGGL